MTTTMTADEFAHAYGVDLEALNAAIDEARREGITKESMDRSTLTKRNITPETERRMKALLAGMDG